LFIKQAHHQKWFTCGRDADFNFACLVVEIGMQSAQFAFIDKCHEHDEKKDNEEKRLTVNKSESA